MEQIINYRDIPTDKRLDILNALERIGFFPAYGGVKTMQQIMEKSVPGSGPQFYFVFRENELIGYNFLIGDTKKYKAFPWLAISNMDEQKLAVCEELMKIQIAFFEELGMHICKKCVHGCKQSFRACLVACPHYNSKRSKICEDKGGKATE